MTGFDFGSRTGSRGTEREPRRVAYTYAIHPSEVWTANRVIMAMAQLS